jgi:TolB protein
MQGTVHTRALGAPTRGIAGLAATALCLLLAALIPASSGAAFPGGNGPIAFDSNRDVGAGEIYSIVPGGAATRLTTSNTSSDPAISPDGSRIAYRSADPGGDYQIFVMNADGTGRTAVTTNPTAKQEPTWSPDGAHIAFVANSFDVDGQTDQEIWTINVNGTGLTQLTNNTFPDTQPAWSPLGDRIAFVSARTGDTNRNIYVMNADGSGPASITPNGATGCSPNCYGGHDDDPAWSPNGTKIAFTHANTITGGGPPNIWTMDPDGANKANVTQSDSVSFSQPAWSPQGDKFAAVGAETTNRDIWVMNVDGSARAPIDTSPSHDINPDWGVPAPPVAVDATPPVLDLGGKKSQKLTKAVKLKAGCGEACTVNATGKLVIGKSKLGGAAARAGKLKLVPAEAQVGAGQTATLKLKLKKKARKAATEALKSGAKVTAKLKATATDASGNASTAKRKIKLKR